jgi:DNA modification methylase
MSNKELELKIIDAKKKGISDEEIGKTFGVTLRKIEEIMIKHYGINISDFRQRKIKSLEPKDFKLENTTVWSFKGRGSWATHSGNYRGNWSPYIPRNVILRYSKPGDVVLDQFVGGGTTAIEAKLLGRRCIAYDINPKAVELTLKNLNFYIPRSFLYEIYEPIVQIGDARNLKNINDESIDLICTHPPYAGIINYSLKIEGDLSNLKISEYVEEMKKVAKECYRVLKQGGKCAILIGDTRKNKKVVPLGFEVINIFLEVGFKLKELVIKIQHNCKTTGFWYERSIKNNFLLLKHEYLPIFEKKDESLNCQKAEKSEFKLEVPVEIEKLEELETATVWLFPENEIYRKLFSNLAARYNVKLFKHGENLFSVLSEEDGEVLNDIDLDPGNYIFVFTEDKRVGGYVCSIAKNIATKRYKNLALKEIIIVAPQMFRKEEFKNELEIVHKYILVFEVV